MASYSLTISNPAIETTSLAAAGVASGTPNTAYIDQPGGNDIDLNISNASGETLTFTAASTDDLLLLQVSNKIMDVAGTAKLKALKPWSVRIPQPGDKDPASDDKYYNFYLSPSSDVSIDDRNSGVISLTDFEPSAKDTGFLQLCFTSDTEDSFTIYSQLIVTGAPQTGLPYLLSDVLKPYVYVNTKQFSPIIVSDLPVTDTNKVENVIQVQFVLQAGPGGLISSWTNLPTPTLRISFPYSIYDTDATTEYDLTDCLAPGTGYNEITSARSIIATVQYPYSDPNSPPMSNDFWQITQVGDTEDTTDLPAWVITPLASNQSLFTSQSKKSLDAGPDPELNIWLSHVFSALPLSECNSTLIYIHWQDFPGFNDGVYVLPLTKELLTIDSFSVTIAEDVDGPQVNFQWEANADSCGVEGASPITETTSVIALSNNRPLRSSYTLTAIASNGVTRVSSILSAEWNINNDSFNNGGPSDFYIGPDTLYASSDGQCLLVTMAASASDYREIARFVDPLHLTPSTLAPIVSPLNDIAASALAPDGYSFYWADFNKLYGHNLKTNTPLPGSAVTHYSAGFSIGIAPKGPDAFSIITCDLQFTYNPSKPAIYRFDSSLQPASTDPLPVHNCYMVKIGSNGTLFAATPTSLVALDSNLNTIAINPTLTGIGQIVPSADETYVYTLSADPTGQNGILSKLDVPTLKPLQQVTTSVIWNPQDYMAYDSIGTLWILSADEELIFLAGNYGVIYLDSGESENISQLFVYYTDTLEQPDWAANLQIQQLQIRGMTLSAFGHRIYVSGSNVEDGSDYLFSIDASFPKQ